MRASRGLGLGAAMAMVDRAKKAAEVMILENCILMVVVLVLEEEKGELVYMDFKPKVWRTGNDTVEYKVTTCE